MPIRFVCEHCGQKLSVSSRVAGRKAKCPKCKEKIAIPEESEQPEKATSAVSEKSSGGDAEERASDSGEHLDENPFAQFAVYDDHNDDEWIYEEDLEIETPKDDRPLDPTKLAVSRRVLYMQGSLLGIVALGCFVFGIIVGFATAPRGDLDAGARGMRHSRKTSLPIGWEFAWDLTKALLLSSFPRIQSRDKMIRCRFSLCGQK